MYKRISYNISSKSMLLNKQTIRYLVLSFIGLANALPIPLAGSILSIWLAESNFSREAIGLFALAGIPFSLKIIWKPIIDCIDIPFFNRSQRKAWLCFSLSGMAITLLAISYIQPADSPWLLAACFCTLSLFSGCLYIVGLAYELESIDESDYSIGSAYTVTGYRIGLLFARAGALYLSSLWDWDWMYRSMSLILFLGGLAILVLPEPYKSHESLSLKRNQLSLYKSPLKAFWNETILRPCGAFFNNSNCMTILFLLITFKLGDQLAKTMVGPFYLSLGFSKVTIASAAKIWGMAATIVGAFLAGLYIKGKNPYSTLTQAGIIHACSLLCYYILTVAGPSLTSLYITVGIENLTGGMAMTTFIHFLWRICDKQYAAVQYALFWSTFTFTGDILASFGGIIANYLEWDDFFLITTACGFTSALTAWTLCKQKNISVMTIKP